MSDLPQRVTKLEEDFEKHENAIGGLTTAVHELTGVLQQGKGAFKVIMWMIAIVSALSSMATWALNHLVVRP